MEGVAAQTTLAQWLPLPTEAEWEAERTVGAAITQPELLPLRLNCPWQAPQLQQWFAQQCGSYGSIGQVP